MRAPLILTLCLLAGPAPAQEVPEPPAGLDLIERGAGLLFRDLLDRMVPQVEGLTEGAQALAPLVGQMAGLVDDIGHYQRPQRLDNGDILIRRRPGAPPPPPLPDGLEGLDRPPLPVDPNAPETEL